MRFALVDSGLGVLPAAMHLRRLCPGAELILSMDPEGMPWGARTVDDIAARALDCAKATLPWEPDVLVLACNTASVRALDVLRAELEPAVPVVGTVPAIKPAAATGEPVSIWATAATTGSPYQRDLISKFADGVPVTEVACPGLADGIERADLEAIATAVAAAASSTPPETRAVVLGCTQYELVMDRIRSALPRVRLHGSAPAVAAQAIRRLAGRPVAQTDAAAVAEPAAAAAHASQPQTAQGQAAQEQDPRAAQEQEAQAAQEAHMAHARTAIAASVGPAGQAAQPGVLAAAGSAVGPTPDGSSGQRQMTGRVGQMLRDADAGPGLHVLLSGELGELPPAALRYAEGRLLAGLRLPSPA